LTPSPLHPAFDWREAARTAATSRLLDELEENELTPQGKVIYQFSARGHELGQILLAQLLTHPFDAAGAYYRSRPFLLASGLPVEEALASDMARLSGVSGGRDVGVVFNMPRRGRALILPMAGDVGSQFTPAAGWAQAIDYRVRVLGEQALAGSMAVVFSGDGAVAANGFWAALTMATTLKLPMLFVVEDNGYAISVTGPAQTPGGNIAANLARFANLQIWDGSGVDPQETAELVATAVAHVRSGQGPGLLRLTVPRLSGHSSADNQSYKTADRRAAEWERDPLPALRRYLVPALMSEADWEGMVKEVEADLRALADSVWQSPEPDPATAVQFAFADPRYPPQMGGLAAEGVQPPASSDQPHPPDPRRLNMAEAIRRTLDVELAANPRCLVFGEDVGLKGGVHAVTLDLQGRHGAERVFDTSLSEEGIIGRAQGMALAGLMPVPEIQFRKYADPATEQLHNIGTLRWRTANRCAAPMVVRIPVGFGRKIGDPWHSVSDESAFAHAVGWQVAYPSNAEDAVGLLRAALRGNDPVVFLEHRALMDAGWGRRPYPGDQYALPFGRARRITEGGELTVVTWGAMVERCDLAARDFAGRVDLLDLRTVIPWDIEAVLESARRTAKCLIVHEEIGVAGFGAEIAATVAQEAFLDLDAPIRRLTMPAVPIPFNVGLMNAILPSVADIRDEMARLLAF
jgi:2-oxoisovalerate dehydrogenase E1 component